MVQIKSIGLLLLTIILTLTSAENAQRCKGFAIIGGEPASITELPHQVYIKRYGLYCGGSIISSQHILTTATCVNTNTSTLQVVAATGEFGDGGDNYTIAKVTKHPGDVAVVKLTKKIQFSDKAKSIALAEPNYKIKDGAKLIASGWGRFDRSCGDTLMKVTVSKVSDEECKHTFKHINPFQEFCAGGEGKKACLLDEGGPLIDRTGGENVLVGVIRYNSGDCREDKEKPPTLYARVSTFNKWIEKIVKQDLEGE